VSNLANAGDKVQTEPYRFFINCDQTSTTFNGAQIFSLKAFDPKSRSKSKRNAMKAEVDSSRLRSLTLMGFPP